MMMMMMVFVQGLQFFASMKNILTDYYVKLYFVRAKDIGFYLCTFAS